MYVGRLWYNDVHFVVGFGVSIMIVKKYNRFC